MLVDSGADVLMIALGLAERLGLDMSSVDTASGISGRVPVYKAIVRAQIEYGSQRLPTMELPVWIPPERGALPVAILGREVFFREYDITFRMGYTPARGKFVLSPAKA